MGTSSGNKGASRRDEGRAHGDSVGTVLPSLVKDGAGSTEQPWITVSKAKGSLRPWLRGTVLYLPQQFISPLLARRSLISAMLMSLTSTSLCKPSTARQCGPDSWARMKPLLRKGFSGLVCFSRVWCAYSTAMVSPMLQGCLFTFGVLAWVVSGT